MTDDTRCEHLIAVDKIGWELEELGAEVQWAVERAAFREMDAIEAECHRICGGSDD